MTNQRDNIVALVEADAPASSSASLVGGLISDVQSLVRQEIALVRQETLEDLARLKSAGMALVPAGALLAFGSLLLVLALAQGAAALLHWPAWAGYAGIGAILAITGILVISIHRATAMTVKDKSHG
jgi:putative superfamily III holin-X